MRNASYPNISQRKPDRSPIDNVATGDSQTNSFSFFQWWYRLTLPIEPPKNASFIRRDSYRKAQLFSNVAFFLIMVFTVSILVGLFLSSPYMLSIAAAELVITCVSLLLNRIGQILAAGIVQVVSFEVILTSVILMMTPLDSASTQMLDLFIVGELLAASLLSVRYVFFVALYNSLFIWLNISYQFYIPDMPSSLHSQFISTIVRTVGLQFLVGGLAVVWVYNATKAISNGDQTEVITTLEHTLAEQRKELESGIEQILQTHVSIANGNLTARVPLAQNHPLWHLARALNSLLARLQRASLSERELHRIDNAVISTVNIIQKSVQQRQQARIPFTQTAIDPLIAAIQGKTFAFTKPLRQQNNSPSTDPVNIYTIDTQISSHHTPP